MKEEILQLMPQKKKYHKRKTLMQLLKSKQMANTKVMLKKKYVQANNSIPSGTSENCAIL